MKKVFICARSFQMYKEKQFQSVSDDKLFFFENIFYSRHIGII